MYMKIWGKVYVCLLYFFKDLFMCLTVFACMYVCVPYMCLVPMEVRKGCQIPIWDYNYECLWTCMWVLRTRHWSSLLLRHLPTPGCCCCFVLIGIPLPISCVLAVQSTFNTLDKERHPSECLKCWNAWRVQTETSFLIKKVFPVLSASQDNYPGYR